MVYMLKINYSNEKIKVILLLGRYCSRQQYGSNKLSANTTTIFLNHKVQAYVHQINIITSWEYLYWREKFT